VNRASRQVSSFRVTRKQISALGARSKREEAGGYGIDQHRFIRYRTRIWQTVNVNLGRVEYLPRYKQFSPDDAWFPARFA
jgi:hypothetical protein